MTKPRRKRIKYSQKIANFICEKVESGLTVAEVCRKYSDKVPSDASIWRWRRDNPEFKEQIDTAYQTLMYTLIDELNDLSKAAPDLSSGDKVVINAELNQRRLRIDSLKFFLAKMAPKMCPDLSDKVTVDHQGQGQQIVIQSYAAPQITTGITIEGSTDETT